MGITHRNGYFLPMEDRDGIWGTGTFQHFTHVLADRHVSINAGLANVQTLKERTFGGGCGVTFVRFVAEPDLVVDNRYPERYYPIVFGHVKRFTVSLFAFNGNVTGWYQWDRFGDEVHTTMQLTLPEPEIIVVSHDEGGQVGAIDRWFVEEEADAISVDEALAEAKRKSEIVHPGVELTQLVVPEFDTITHDRVDLETGLAITRVT